MAVVPGDLETAGCPVGVDGDGTDRHVHRSYAVARRPVANTTASVRPSVRRGADRHRPDRGPLKPGYPPPVSLEIDHVTKRFGRTTALDGLTFEVGRGEVFGFLGANGAGKTTTMRICLGIVVADDGRDPLGRPAGRRGAAPDVGLPARGAWSVSADGRPRPARLLRLAVRRRAGACASGRPRLAGPLPHPRVRRRGAPRSCPRATSRRSSSSRRSCTTPRSC